MPILTGHGHGCGVTKPSMSPRRQSEEHEPDRDRASDRAVLGERSPRERGPGATHAQKMRRPAAAATKMHVSSSRPCGRMKRKNMSPRRTRA